MEYEVATEIEVQRVIWGDAVPEEVTDIGRVSYWMVKEVAPRDGLLVFGGFRGRRGDEGQSLVSFPETRPDLTGNRIGICQITAECNRSALEPYFKALEENRIEDQIPRLLETEDEIVLLRTLELDRPRRLSLLPHETVAVCPPRSKPTSAQEPHQ